MIRKSYVVCLAVCSLDMYGVCLLYTANIYNIFVTNKKGVKHVGGIVMIEFNLSGFYIASAYSTSKQSTRRTIN